jgi:hypothetical protein
VSACQGDVKAGAAAGERTARPDASVAQPDTS